MHNESTFTAKLGKKFEWLLWKFFYGSSHSFGRIFFTTVAYFEIPLEFADDVNVKDFEKLLVLTGLACNFYSNLHSTFIKNNVSRLYYINNYLTSAKLIIF